MNFNGIKLFPVPDRHVIAEGEIIDYGKFSDFVGSLVEKALEMKNPHVTAVKGEIYIYEAFMSPMITKEEIDKFESLMAEMSKKDEREKQ